MDPWSGGGVLAAVTGAPSLTIINIPGAAHHLDLRTSNPGDTQALKAARALEKATFRAWLGTPNTTMVAKTTVMAAGTAATVPTLLGLLMAAFLW